MSQKGAFPTMQWHAVIKRWWFLVLLAEGHLPDQWICTFLKVPFQVGVRLVSGWSWSQVLATWTADQWICASLKVPFQVGLMFVSRETKRKPPCLGSKGNRRVWDPPILKGWIDFHSCSVCVCARLAEQETKEP